MTIHTGRLLIRPLLEEDSKFMFELLNTDDWLKYIGNRNIQSEREALAYIKNVNQINKESSGNIWTVKLIGTNKDIGIITFIHRDYLDYNDIGFAFLPAFYNKGYAYEATKAVLIHLVEHRSVKTVYAITLPENRSSIKLLEKLGLSFERILERNDEKLHLYIASNEYK